MNGRKTRPPLSTYRLQLTPDFGFAAAAALTDYVSALGITHLHTSPCLQAAAGSTHGYDVVDHGRPSSELGGEPGRAALCRAVAAHGLGQVLDIVPNHMAVDTPRNRLWWHVLQHGPRSTYAAFFDIDWNPPDPELTGRVLLPILGTDLATAIRERALYPDVWQGEPVLRYHEHVMPLRPDSVDAARAYGAAADADPAALRRLVDRQYYRLAHWREAARRINYRRFFAINSLAGIRVEDEPVFQATHRTVLDWVHEGSIDGLRVDHPDGLRDPGGYLRHLVAHAPAAWIVVEKILGADEVLPPDWPVAGTTGYDFLHRASGLFVDPNGEQPLTEFYRDFTGEAQTYDELLFRKKRDILESSFGGETRTLTHLLAQVLEAAPADGRAPVVLPDARPRMSTALHAVLAAFPVYRSYLDETRNALRPVDADLIRTAIRGAARRLDPEHRDVLSALQRVLLREIDTPPAMEFRMRFQQLCAPAMAKGGEDTAFYCFNRLVSLNEVGGDPGCFGTSPDEFHAFCRRIQQDWPRTMTTLATHDTKRGADTRLRIHTLSEVPAAWRAAVERWSAAHADLHRPAGPDRNTEYLVYQTLVGTWPIDAGRLTAYMEKAVREAKQHTTWEDPDAEYENAVRGFVTGLLRREAFIRDLEAFLGPIVHAARIASLAQTLLACLAPGVPDVYQGTELWDLSLVDPDNRRPVDYERRRRGLAALETLAPREILGRMEEGLPKLWVLRQALRLRRAQPDCFGPAAAYTPLLAEGPMAHHVVSFLRAEDVLCVVPRLVLGLRNHWAGTTLELPRGQWRNLLTASDVDGGRTAVDRLLKPFPVALLQRRQTRSCPA